ncbi:MAG: hypothetical protein LM632_01085 [Armatimonadetes bacterium]|nr:hypothetical protein [Armatimonadota bacterium]
MHCQLSELALQGWEAGRTFKFNINGFRRQRLPHHLFQFPLHPFWRHLGEKEQEQNSDTNSDFLHQASSSLSSQRHGLRVPNAKVCRSSAFNDSTDSEPNFRHQFACELLAQDIGVNRLRRNFRTLSAIPRSYLLGKGKKGAYSAPLENL